MTTFRFPPLWLCALAALVTLLPARLAATDLYFIVKNGNYVQKSAATVSYASATPFQFGAITTVASTLTSPGSSTATTLTYNSTDGGYEYSSNYASQQALDASFPTGTYTLTTSSIYVSIAVPADEFPAIPSVLNGAWNTSGQLQLDPTVDSTLKFATFGTFNLIGVASEVLFYIEDSTGTTVSYTEWTTPTDTTAPTSFVVKNGVLSPGKVYTAHLDYSTFSTNDSTSVANSQVEAEFGQYTTFTIVATAPPTNSIAANAQPQSLTVANGGAAVLTFGVTATPAATYQWYFNNAAISGATSSSLVLSNTTYADAGPYYCVATNSAGQVQSSSATLAVSSTSDLGHLIDISCRAQVGTGANILITGFALGGPGTAGQENLLLRASGPALADYGISSGFLPDPELELYAGTTEMDSNTGWSGDAAIAAAAASVGAFPWHSISSHDAALVAPLGAGAYTTEVLGQAGDGGVALAEIYDDPAGGLFSPTRPRLINISARVQVGTGSNTLIAGFVIGGSTAETVLIRATGPTLATFGLSGLLADPKLVLFDSSSNVLASNTVWGGDAGITAAAAKVGAFSWAPVSADSALLVTLPPGSYSAQVSGASGDTGVALVEVYEVP